MKCLVICGQTASGKSKLAIDVAMRISSCIINADSQQVWQGLPILTDQPSSEDMAKVEHKLYGYQAADETHSSFRWCNDAADVIKSCIDCGKLPILVGGTGFYIKRLIEGHTHIPINDINLQMTNSEMYKFLQSYDPDLKISQSDTYRLTRATSVILQTGKPFSWWMDQPKHRFIEGIEFIKILVDLDKESVYEKCKYRLDQMFPAVINEVRASMVHDNMRSVLGFKQIQEHICGLHDLEKTKESILTKTMQYAKRQRTWFRHQMHFDLVCYSNDIERCLSILD